MPIPSYSRKLVVAQITALTTWTALYTPPPGHRTIVKTVTLHNLNAGAAAAGIGYLTGYTMHYVTGVPSITVVEWNTWIVLEPGDTLALYAYQGPWNVTAHGQELLT